MPGLQMPNPHLFSSKNGQESFSNPNEKKLCFYLEYNTLFKIPKFEIRDYHKMLCIKHQHFSIHFETCKNFCKKRNLNVYSECINRMIVEM